MDGRFEFRQFERVLVMGFFKTRFIMFEEFKMGISELIGDGAEPFFEIFFKMSFHPASIVIEKGSDSFSFPLSPFSLIDGLNSLRVSFVLKPVICPSALWKVIFPFTFVFLIRWIPTHDSLPFFFISYPLSIVLVTWWISHLPQPWSHPFLELAFIHWRIAESENSFTFFEPIDPLSLIGWAILRAIVLSVSFSLSIDNISVVIASIRPGEFSFSSGAIECELSFIDESVLPAVGSLSVHESFVEVSLIGVAIEEGDVSDAM